MEQQLASGLGEGQIAELVEDDKVTPGQQIGEPTLATVAGFGLEPVDQIDDVEVAGAGAVTDAAPRDGDGEMALAGAGSADQHGIALAGQEGARGQLSYQGLVDRGAGEVEVGQLLGQRQLGDAHLVLDRSGLLVGEVEPGRVWPDFSFETPDGDVVIWEHLGMSSRPDYRASWERKLAWYEKNEYVLSETLFTMEDDENGAFDSQEIDNTISKIRELL